MDILFSRTGVTILSDILRYCADHNIDIDIPKVKIFLRHFSNSLFKPPGSFTLATTKDVDGANRCPGWKDNSPVLESTSILFQYKFVHTALIHYLGQSRLI